MTYFYVRAHNNWHRLRDQQQGQTLVEYALILTFIAVVAIGALTLLGGKISDLFTNIANDLPPTTTVTTTTTP